MGWSEGEEEEEEEGILLILPRCRTIDIIDRRLSGFIHVMANGCAPPERMLPYARRLRVHTQRDQTSRKMFWDLFCISFVLEYYFGIISTRIRLPCCEQFVIFEFLNELWKYPFVKSIIIVFIQYNLASKLDPRFIRQSSRSV